MLLFTAQAEKAAQLRIWDATKERKKGDLGGTGGGEIILKEDPAGKATHRGLRGGSQ